jgi:uncharacterized membrane protein YphA (DoxX/SURF4 family)
MKIVTNIAGALLGLLFLFAGLTFFFHIVPMPPPPPADSPAGMFMGALFPTGYLAFVKVLETLGGLLTAIPRTRVIGLFILGPIIVNIVAFGVFIVKGATLKDPMTLTVVALFLFLVWAHRRNLRALLAA